jgi:hypothetical protein
VEEFTGIAVFCSEFNRAEPSEELGASYVSRDAFIRRMNTLVTVTQDVSCLCQVALPVFRQQNVTALLLLLTEDDRKEGHTIQFLGDDKLHFSAISFHDCLHKTRYFV